jgi:uncharacterized DUF497 family protein
MIFEWDERKNWKNLQKHGVRFEAAIGVFADPAAMTARDEFSEEEERWITLGAAETNQLLVVVHTRWEEDNEEAVRIISVRPANSRESRLYQSSHLGNEAGTGGAREEKGRGH